MRSIAENLRLVRERVDEAAQRSGRDPEAVQIIAVSKGFGVASMNEAIAQGQYAFGENRVQELVSKVEQLGADVQWHFIGRLQSNKVAKVLECRAVIHSVDRMSLVDEIDRRAVERCKVMIEVNTSEEPAKAGVRPEEARALVDSVVSRPGLELLGLMTMAPQLADPEGARAPFRALAALKMDLERQIPGLTIHHLSMGMSQDYGVAVEEGATMVRIGEAIFGTRRNGRSEKK